MKCVICETDFTQKTRVHIYCSKKCKSRAGNILISKKPNEKKCTHCSLNFKPYTSLDKFCSLNCRIENMKSKRSKRWNAESTLKISGKNNPSYKSGMYARSTKRNDEGQREFLRVRNEMRANMILKHGFLFCEKCNTTETYQWEMHHLIYRSEKPLHEHLHNPINLINLCMKCHNWFHKNKSNRNDIVESRKLYELFGDDVRDKKI
jgi:5-methylcytosine-specific restriction endonuclease McrA